MMNSPKRANRFPFGGKKSPPSPTSTTHLEGDEKDEAKKSPEQKKSPEEQKKPGLKFIKAAVKSLGMGNMMKQTSSTPEESSITTGGAEEGEDEVKEEVLMRETTLVEEKEQGVCQSEDTMNGHDEHEVMEEFSVGLDNSSEGSAFGLSFLSFEMLVLATATTYLTILNEAKILNDEVPLVVAGLWILVAFAAGFKCSGLFFEKIVSKDESIALFDGTSESPYSAPTEARVSLIQRAGTIRRLFSRPGRRQKEAVHSPQANIWTALNPKDKLKVRWQRNADPTLDEKNSSLMQKLLMSQRFRRKRRAGTSADTEETVGKPLLDDSGHEIGSFNIGDSIADSLDDYVIEPIFKLRGMDIFLTDDPETNVAQHPWLIRQGLRSVPTYIVNILTQWGNILIYFEMPLWVNDWENLKENEDDPDDVKAIKRFIKGDDEYRNQRLKLVPSVVEAPAPVRMLAPPKKGRTVNCPLVPVKWAMNKVETTEDGTKLCFALESELDCVSNKMMRGMASIVKRNLHLLAIDAAVIIDKPDGQLEDEPSACVGLWRFNHIDISKCPKFPDRFAEEAARTGKNPDFLRASVVVCSA